MIRAVAGFDQRPDAGEDAEHIGARRRLGEVAARGLEDELDLLVERARLERRLGDRRVGRADQRVAVPGNREHHAAVARVRHHDRACRPGRNDRSNTRCTPWLGAIIGCAPGSSSRRTPSRTGRSR